MVRQAGGMELERGTEGRHGVREEGGGMKGERDA